MHWRLVECSGCRLLFASPAPTPDALAQAYGSADYDSQDEALYASRTYKKLLADWIDDLPRGAALDVGAGDGAFLGVLRELGFEELTGVEPSQAALEAADAGVRPFIREGVFDPSEFEAGEFRLISCLHVVDHMSDPVAAMKGAHRLLSSGGALFVVCHDRRAPVNRLMGQRSPIYDIEHLQLFCRRSLAAVLGQAGFRAIEIRSYWNRYPLRYWLRLAPLEPRVRERLTAMLTSARVEKLPLSLPTGNLAAVAWKDRSA